MRDTDGCWVYIVRCVDGSYYTGSTRGHVDARVSEHNGALRPNSFTATRRPVTLVFAEHFPVIVDAIAMERRIKGWSRAKKEAFIAGDFARLSSLSKRSGALATKSLPSEPSS